MLNETNQLNNDQLNDLEQLKTACKEVDGSIPNLYVHLLTQKRNLASTLLYYEQQQLVGFLSVYSFYEDAVEIALLVHPSFRRKNIAQKLLLSILPLIKEQNFSNIIFSGPSHVNNHWLPNLGFSYKHSEYYMERHDLSPLINYKNTLTFHTATIQDIPLLCILDEACFFKTQEELIPRFQHILSDRNYQILLAYENNHLIGKAHLRWQKYGATLSDIAVLPIKQGKGFGTALITHCINYALSEGKPNLSLDVETHNKKALNLYTRLGFQTQNACDYWKIELYQLEKLLHSKQND
jgi:ribosomal protein S18 acetylase RimI-like enzyme